MNFNRKDTIIFSLLIAFVSVGVIGTVLQQNQTAEATGCPANFVKEHVDQALKSFESGDYPEVKNQLDLAKDATKVFEEEDE